jgi:membrane protease YdiL (CAAX protease family)
MTRDDSMPGWLKAIVFFVTYYLFIGLVSIAFYRLSYLFYFSEIAEKPISYFHIVDELLKQPGFAHFLAFQLIVELLFTIVFLWLFKLAFDQTVSDLLHKLKRLKIRSLFIGSFAGTLVGLPAIVLWLKADIHLKEFHFNIPYILWFSVIYLCVSIIEETITRGYILVKLEKSLGK